MIVFVILHYKTIKDTLECIESIRRNVPNGKIIVVDNGSKIKADEETLSTLDIDLLISKENLGFANGNNVGSKYALKKYNPKYLCVLNSDTLILQNSFESIIEKLYQKYNFDALGPKILPEELNSCNPFHAYETVEEIDMAIKKASKQISIYNNPIKASVYMFLKKIKGKIKPMKILENGKKDALDVSLHGCAIIFSNKYLNKYENIFYEGTFLFHEEEFLTYRMRRDKLTFLYSPSLEIMHKEEGSQKDNFVNIAKKEVFRNNNIIKSLNILKKVISEDKRI